MFFSCRDLLQEFSQTNSFKTKPEIFFSKNDRNPTPSTGGFRNDTVDFSNSRISWDVYLNENCAVDNGRKPVS